MTDDPIIRIKAALEDHVLYLFTDSGGHAFSADDIRTLLNRLKAAEAEAQRLRESLRGLLAVTSSKAPGTGLIVGAEDRHAAAIKQAREALENTDAR